LWFSVLMSDIENAFLSSFGMLSRSSTLAILIEVRESLKWKFNFLPSCLTITKAGELFAITVQEPDLETTLVTQQ